jgi:hypothetical protein
MDEIRRITGLLELYDNALQGIRDLHDPGLDELECRLNARASAAAHDYFEHLAAAGTINPAQRLATSQPTPRTAQSPGVAQIELTATAKQAHRRQPFAAPGCLLPELRLTRVRFGTQRR